MSGATRPRVLVVADDLTGANATGARFARAGLRAATVSMEGIDQDLSAFDVVVVSTDSRHLNPQAAAEAVAVVADSFGAVELLVKRTDTTLRGNVASETAAALEALRRSYPDERVRALAVPAFPSSGRVTVDGIQLLGGVPLEKTELRYDGQNPMTTSSVSSIISDGTPLTVRHVGLRTIIGDPDALVAALVEGDEDVVICDSLEEHHLLEIADAAARAHTEFGVRWLCVDPGPTGAALAKALGLAEESPAAPPLLAVVASITDLSQKQSDYLAESELVTVLEVSATRLAGEDEAHLDVGDAVAQVSRAMSDRLAHMRFPEQLLVRTPPSLDAKPLSVEGRRQLPGLIAAAVIGAITDTPVAGLYASGGDIASGILEAADVVAFEILGEVVPLAVYGTIVGGPLDGLPVVTKGGLIGTELTGEACMNQLRRLSESRLIAARSRGDASETMIEETVLTEGNENP